MDKFAALDLRVGEVTEASLVKGADALISLVVDIGEAKPRHILSGIRASYQEPERLVGKKVMVLANIKPRKTKFGISEGMVITGQGKDGKDALATFLGEPLPGDGVS
ncbi:MAG: hypothetical protein QNJ97_01190 [Myxococcota bacterium]|nr:hypothetical protein [Myxococcota bacterium]